MKKVPARPAKADAIEALIDRIVAKNIAPEKWWFPTWPSDFRPGH